MSPGQQKAELRRTILGKRDAVAVEARVAASQAICARLAALPELMAASSLSAFWPLGSEVDLIPLLEKWCSEGKEVALPVMTGDTLQFRRWTKNTALLRKPFGVMEPEGADEVVPEIVLVPLVGFDRSGARLGYGKGFYDRALSALRDGNAPMTIGVAFAMQHVATLPQEPHDQPLEVIVTEAETIRV